MASYAARASVFLLVAMLVLHTALACFITNCPPGGKRSLGDQKRSTRQCPACGPAGLGRCFGSNLCCGPQVGCFLNTRESAICRYENLSPVPCENDATPCAGSGKCAADGLCCTNDECRMDEHCRQDTEVTDHRMSNTYQRLLHSDIATNDLMPGHRYLSS